MTITPRLMAPLLDRAALPFTPPQEQRLEVGLEVGKS